MELYQREDQTTRCQPVANIQTFLMAWQQEHDIESMTLLSTGPLVGAVVLVNADPWLRDILMGRRQKPAWRMWQVLEVRLNSDGVSHPLVSQSTCMEWGTSMASSALPPLRSHMSQPCVAPARWRLQLSPYKAPWISRWGYMGQGCSNLSWSS